MVVLKNCTYDGPVQSWKNSSVFVLLEGDGIAHIKFERLSTDIHVCLQSDIKFNQCDIKHVPKIPDEIKCLPRNTQFGKVVYGSGKSPRRTDLYELNRRRRMNGDMSRQIPSRDMVGHDWSSISVNVDIDFDYVNECQNQPYQNNSVSLNQDIVGQITNEIIQHRITEVEKVITLDDLRELFRGDDFPF